jgi:hypothetical protein
MHERLWKRFKLLSVWLALLPAVSVPGGSLAPALTSGIADEPAPGPRIRKLGTIDLDLVEATPVVFNNRLYRFEYIRPGYTANQTGDSYFRFVDVSSGETSRPFAHTFDLGSAFTEAGVMWVFAVDHWDGERVCAFRSVDLEQWEQIPALHLPGWGLFNTSVTRAGERYVMAIEVGKPADVAGVPFTTLFAESANLREWSLLPESHVFTKERYSACPSIRFVDGWFYMTYLEACPGPTYETHIVRSRDLKRWESSPLNPVLRAEPDLDRKIANPRLTAKEREKISKATDINNSDFDFCEFQGNTYITYSWGNQQGTEFLAEAIFEGPIDRFLKAYFH